MRVDALQLVCLLRRCAMYKNKTEREAQLPTHTEIDNTITSEASSKMSTFEWEMVNYTTETGS